MPAVNRVGDAETPDGVKGGAPADSDSAPVIDPDALAADSSAEAHGSAADAAAPTADSASSVGGAAPGTAGAAKTRASAAAATCGDVLPGASAPSQELVSSIAHTDHGDSHKDAAGADGAGEGMEDATCTSAALHSTRAVPPVGDSDAAQAADTKEPHSRSATDSLGRDSDRIGRRPDLPLTPDAGEAGENRAGAAASAGAAERLAGVQEARLRAQAAMADSIAANVCRQSRLCHPALNVITCRLYLETMPYHGIPFSLVQSNSAQLTSTEASLTLPLLQMQRRHICQ